MIYPINPQVKVEAAPGVKCPRCWKVHLGMNFDDLCNRCVAIICKHFREHEAYPHIVENLEKRGLKPEDNPEWDKV